MLKFGSSAFRTYMAQVLQPQVAVMHEFIVTVGDMGNEMYFLLKGQVSSCGSGALLGGGITAVARTLNMCVCGHRHQVEMLSRGGHVLLQTGAGSFFGETAVLDRWRLPSHLTPAMPPSLRFANLFLACFGLGCSPPLSSKTAATSVRALTECELYMLTRGDLERVLRFFPEFETTLRKLASVSVNALPCTHTAAASQSHPHSHLPSPFCGCS